MDLFQDGAELGHVETRGADRLDLKGKVELLKKIDDAEAMLRSLRNALS